MSLQGPMLVVADHPAVELVEALSAAGAFPVVEANWTDAPTAFVSVKPSAVVIAESDAPPSEASARMLCLQIATASGPIVPTLAFANQHHDPALPIALPADAGSPLPQALARLQSAMRVRALHATVLRRIALAAADGGTAPCLPDSDPLEEATILLAGRGRHYAALSGAMAGRVKLLGALSLEGAARLLDADEVDGIVLGDGFPPRAVDTFLARLADTPNLRDLPVAVMGNASDVTNALTHAIFISEPAQLGPRMVPLLRMRAFETRLVRMLVSLDAGGMVDAATGLMVRDAFYRHLAAAVAEASDRSMALSLARYSFDGTLSERSLLDGARRLTRLTRTIDFACRDDDGSILIAFTQTNLREAHGIARRIAAALKNAMSPREALTANVTLATLKAGDTADSLMQRVMDSRMVAAE